MKKVSRKQAKDLKALAAAAFVRAATNAAFRNPATRKARASLAAVAAVAAQPASSPA